MSNCAFLQELEWRGLIQDVSNPEAIKALAAGEPFYVGFDPSAASLTIGNLLPLMAALHMARQGLKPILLFGGATGAIGDPSGKSAERKLLSQEEVERNIAGCMRKVKELFSRAGVTPTYVNNYEWTKGVSCLEFLREVGKHFTVNYMLAKDSVKLRMGGEGISYTEFSYMLLQAFDFMHLYKTHQCKLQIGGSDQWGNITAGCELIRRKLGVETYALSFPLLLDAQGKKFGKSESGAVWLDENLTSPYRFHQFWLNRDDNETIKCLKIFTLLSKDQVEGLEVELRSRPEARAAQRTLADSVCTLIHGESATADAKRSAEVLFGGSLSGLPLKQLQEIFADVPSSTLSPDKVQNAPLVDVCVQAGFIKSKGEAKRLISSGGLYLNNERVNDPEIKLNLNQAIEGQLVVLRSGKKNYYLIRIA